MGGIGEQPPPSSSAPAKIGPPPPPQPSTSMDTLFNGGSSGGSGFGFSPGPMTLVSNFFNENDDFKSFSQLLTGAMPSPLLTEQDRPSVEQPPMLAVSPGLSPSGFLDPPRLFSASQVSGQGMQVNENSSSFTSIAKRVQTMPPSASSIADSGTSSLSMKECPDDGFNWRKYGQKQVKGSEFPRSYYKCTHPNCPVKKKVEKSIDDDHVVAIIYKGQHNHQPLRLTSSSNKHAKDTALAAASNVESFNARGTTRRESTAPEHVAEGSSDDSEEAAGYRDTDEVEEKNDEPDPKRRRNTEAMVHEAVSSHRTAMEPRIIVQTTSEVDLLDDGYRWRKYGQKVVKGNPFPRSYYKCTTTGCNVRKHVERASSDPKAVITTYEGKHNHNVPAAKSNSHTIANNPASQLRPHNTTIPERISFINGGGIGGANQQQQPVARLRLKNEQIT
ncbi:probable WRKY transcription factor 4 [Prosopis cineraria]|uniref:probable WRKY transcription factor 4 n=1 Tax=Prosopis cineraria TaxID=364024 RepID=UPI002410168D|nr:probable WRKY transcription factor 4 [Prosopis cineraria]XP_054809614.1 probable WRKY transcription factor 4 [Prosopis cineraria]